MKTFVKDRFYDYVQPLGAGQFAIAEMAHTTVKPLFGQFITKNIPGIERNFEGVLKTGTKVNIWKMSDGRFVAVVQVELGDLLSTRKGDRTRITFESWAVSIE